MPSKGSSLKTGKRFRIVTASFWRRFKRETGIEIPYITFSTIINETNSLTAQRIIENTSGFKLPEGLGYLAVTRYKDNKRKIDFKKSKELGFKIYFTNFHSYGYSNRICWFANQIARCKFHQIYKFIPERKVNRDLGQKTLSGKIYNEYLYDHFKQKRIRLNIDKRLESGEAGRIHIN